jgi:hypothetical protein
MVGGEDDALQGARPVLEPRRPKSFTAARLAQARPPRCANNWVLAGRKGLQRNHRDVTR